MDGGLRFDVSACAMKKRTAFFAAACLASLCHAALAAPAAEKPSDAKRYAAWHTACVKENKAALGRVTEIRHDHPTAAANEQALVHAFNQMTAARKPTAADLSNMDKALQSGMRDPFLMVKICYTEYTLGMTKTHP
jgi:hypothetical protein